MIWDPKIMGEDVLQYTIPESADRFYVIVSVLTA